MRDPVYWLWEHHPRIASLPPRQRFVVRIGLLMAGLAVLGTRLFFATGSAPRTALDLIFSFYAGVGIVHVALPPADEMYRSGKRMGRYEAHSDVLRSFAEASRRGIAFEEWLASEIERTNAAAVSAFMDTDAALLPVLDEPEEG